MTAAQVMDGVRELRHKYTARESENYLAHVTSRVPEEWAVYTSLHNGHRLYSNEEYYYIELKLPFCMESITWEVDVRIVHNHKNEERNGEIMFVCAFNEPYRTKLRGVEMKTTSLIQAVYWAIYLQ